VERLHRLQAPGLALGALGLRPDHWLLIRGENEARTWAAKHKVAVISITHFNKHGNTLVSSDEDSFLSAMSAAREGRFVGWTLPNIQRETKSAIERKPFPFQLGDVLPWWKLTDELAQGQPKEREG
jgi:hypothetical protein